MKPIYVVLLAVAVLIMQGCYPEPVANFDFSYNDNMAPALVSFSNYSTDAEEYTWNFGDGNTSTSHSPTHTYEEGGTYSISLTAKGRGGENTMSKSISIIQPTSYIVRNLSSYTLYTVISFYWDGSNVIDEIMHGDMNSGSESAEVITTHNTIDVAFYLSDGYLYLVTDPYALLPNTSNYLDIYDHTNITSNSKATDMQSIKAIRSIRENGNTVQLKNLVGQ